MNLCKYTRYFQNLDLRKKNLRGQKKKIEYTKMRRPGIEPGSTAWKAAMLTTIPPTPLDVEQRLN